MKFNAETSVLLGNVLGIQEDNKDSNSTKHCYNDWSERQKRFASQYNSSAQLNLQTSQQNINSSFIPNHNNKILLKKDFSKGPSLSLHNQQLSSGQILDQNILLNRVDNYYQIPTANPQECKICQINNSICSVCLQRQSKVKKKFLNPKGSESFSTNIPLYKYQRLSDQERLNNSYSYGESSKQSMIRKKIMPNKKEQNSRESLSNSQQLNSLQEKYQDMLKIKFKPLSNSNQNLSLISSIDNKQNISISLDILTQKESQTSKQIKQPENKDEKILSDNYMNYILRIRQEELENPSANYLQTEYNSSIQYENNDIHDKIKLKNQLPTVQELQNNQTKKTNEISQQNPTNLSLQNQLKILDLNNLLSKQKNCSNYVNSQYIFDSTTTNKKNNLMNITQLNFIERNNFVSKKKYESSIYKKVSQDKRANQDNIQAQNPIVAATQTIQEYQKGLKKPKKNIIYSKVKPHNQQNNNEKENENIYKDNDDSIVKRNKSQEEIVRPNKQQFPDQNQQNLIHTGNNSLNKSYSKFQNEKFNYFDLDEKSEIIDYVEESYNDDQIFSGKNKNIADQLQKYVRNLKIKIQQQNSQPKNIQYKNINQSEKENKKLVALEPSEIKLSSLTQKSSDKNIFNFKYRKTLLKASTNFNTNPNNQSIEMVEQDSIKYLTIDPKDQQKQDSKMLNQDSTASLDALPISFPKLHKSQIKKNISINQRSDLQLNAQKLNVGNRLDKQISQNAKDLFYDSKTNKKQVEKQIIYSQSFSKQNKLIQNQHNLSSNKQIKTDPDMNETELTFKNGIQMNTFLNKNRISLKEIQCSNQIDVNQTHNNHEQIERQNLKQLENLQDIDLCEWKHSPYSFVSNIDEQFLLEKQENIVYESISINKAKKRKYKLTNKRNINQQSKEQ
ncbi:hypothetical protein TTHERM_00826970 (macronuclear) [Tetrahymena thermophila SB210]|uniref:Uncharacterized protein n=1 Tax=Tetrahymena thermophila (strain SB210) TaxID=312017 RepID=Q22EH2_TETTS|nr:hypothetical protein TTHERM_00826970 [Tetrahymena thermophila SB210]EAR83680.1 hypothetical protein TTHERM_00826970 [Tetrahymena thermophila SB210]|eukprot:XP_001031343.1 hypothetical protein TTHERM_00826970 [Tetrahymena thermophila SB210]